MTNQYMGVAPSTFQVVYMIYCLDMFQQLMSIVSASAQLFFRMKFKENPRKTRIKKTYLPLGKMNLYWLPTSFQHVEFQNDLFFIDMYRTEPKFGPLVARLEFFWAFGGLTLPSIEALEMMSGKIFAVKQSIVDDTWRVWQGLDDGSSIQMG